MLKAVIFDLDGVLIDSEPLMRLAFESVYHQVIGQGEPPTERFLEHMGESFPRILDRLGLPRSMWEPYREFCQKNIDRIAIFPGSCRLLERLAQLDLKLAILTGKDRLRTLQILDHFGLLHFFDEVVTSDQLHCPKPNPEGVLRALHLLDCAADEAVMVGDAVNDIVCAQQAGITAIAVTWGIKPDRVQTLCEPDYIVDGWDSLFQALLCLHMMPGVEADAILDELGAVN